MTARRKRRTLGAWAAVGLALAGLVLVGPADAAPNQYATSIGTATGTVVTTPVNVPVSIRTSAPCPTGSGVVNGFMNSTDAGIADAVVVSANSTDLGTLTTTGMPLDNNLLGLASSAGRVLVNGRYDVAIVCFPDAFSAPTAQFDATFTVTGGASQTSPGTSATWDVAGSEATTTSLGASPEGSAALGARVTLTATVSPAGAVGSVRFTDTSGAGTILGDPVALSAGRAVLTTSTLPQGVRSIVASFLPGNGFLASDSSPLAYTVLGANQVLTTTALSVSPSGTVPQGASVTMTATVTPATASGSVTFVDGTAPLGQPVVVTNGVATFSTAALDPGGRSIAAQFAPDDPAAFSGSRSPVVALVVVPPAGPTGPFLDDLTVDGTRGTVTDALGIQLKAPSACPGGDTVTARVQGPGEWQAGLPVPVEGVFRAAGDTVAIKRLDSTAAISPGKYFVTVVCAESTGSQVSGFFLARIWFYDATHWLSQDPLVVGIPTTGELTVAPADRAQVAAAVQLDLTLDAPAARGKVTFDSELNATTTTLGTAAVKDGRARLTTTTLEFGLHYLTATFVPDATTPPYNGSTTREVAFAVTKGLPPVPRGAATVRGTVTVGSTVRCVATFSGAGSVTYLWQRDRTTIGTATRAAYRLTAADRGRQVRCRATATNASGTVYRVSRPVRIGV
ncbi:MAG: Ig-like domain-containing protein [Kineosporiaceae bacterium]